MGISRIRCCKGCHERELGCHSVCERYIKEKDQAVIIDHNVSDYLAARHKAIDHRKHRMKRR